MIKDYQDMLKILSDQIEELIEINKSVTISTKEKHTNIITIAHLIDLMARIMEKSK